MKIGDLVTHKYDGGVGIITDHTIQHSNITMGLTEWVVIKWVEHGTNHKRTKYMPAYLELIKPTDKN